MNISQLKESKFLKKEDCGTGILVTIQSVSQENIAKEGAEPEHKWVLHFRETEKPMVLNSTNGQLIAKIIGSDETDDWTGHKIVAYEDPNISFAGKIVGGIRVRAPKNQVKPAPAKPLAEPGEDDVPF
jgi:hypothetical protein